MQEALPPNSTHDSVRQIFKQFGSIAYVSLPKYKSGRIKEFAFVEFDQKSSVEKCIKTFRHFDAVISDSYQPDKLLSITSYLAEQQQQQNQSDRSNENIVKNINENEKIKSNENEKNPSDLDGSNDVSDVDSLPSNASQPPPKKRIKLDFDSNQLNDEENKKCDDSSDGDETKPDESENDENVSAMTNQCKRRRRKRRKNKIASVDSMNLNEQNFQPAEPNESDLINIPLHLLRVATKIEWKRLRNKYLSMQREQYTQLKKLYAQNKSMSKLTTKSSTLPPLPPPVVIKNKSSASKPMCTRNINFYGANDNKNNDIIGSSTMDDTECDSKKSQSNEKKNLNRIADQLNKGPTFQLEPGIIVKVCFDEPCIDVIDFKAEMKQYSFVKYVDLKEGQTAAYIRVDTPHSSPQLIKHCAPRRCQILTGNSEMDYWKKIERDRKEKLTKSVKLPDRNRGKKTKKLLNNLSDLITTKSFGSHIRFDED